MSLKVVTSSEAVSKLRKNDAIGFGLGPGIPDIFLTSLAEREDWDGLTLGGALILNYYKVLENPNVHYRSGFFGPAERIHLGMGHNVELVPGGFRQFGPILERFSPRVFCLQGTPPDRDGKINLSLHYGATYKEILRAAKDPDRLLIVEANESLPKTHSMEPFSNEIDVDIVDLLIETNNPVYELSDSNPSEIDSKIAEIATSYINDGATLQTGIGSIPTQVADLLSKRDGGNYGIHSEMFTTGLMKLHKAGKVTNTNKGIFDNKSVTTFSLGTRELYNWLDNNDQVAFLPVEKVNDPSIISQNHDLISINGALEVDIFGQVVADFIDEKQVSGVGGHEDFVSGTETNRGSHSLICLPSTVETNGEVKSRIVRSIGTNGIVSTPRHHLDIVVTEFGAAEVMGLTVKERAHVLADIAHPSFRGELHKAADTL